MLTEIENLSLSELKSQRDELIERAKKSDVGELAARYVKARTDAAMRDEKLAEQGKTIQALQQSTEDCRQKISEMEKDLKSARAKNATLEETLNSCRRTHEEECEDWNKENFEIKKQVQELQSELGKAHALAKQRRTVLAEIMKLVSTPLADEG